MALAGMGRRGGNGTAGIGANGTGVRNAVLASTPASTSCWAASLAGPGAEPAFRRSSRRLYRAPPPGADPGQHLITSPAAEEEQGERVGV